MRRIFIVIGLTMIVASGGISAVGHYDGVLGAVPAEEVLSPDAPAYGTFRVLVLGTVPDAEAQFEAFRENLLLPGPMVSQMEAGPYVPIRFDARETPAVEGYLRSAGEPTFPGQLLVVKGRLGSHWPLLDRGDRVESVPVLFLEADEHHEPILFKTFFRA